MGTRRSVTHRQTFGTVPEWCPPQPSTSRYRLYDRYTGTHRLTYAFILLHATMAVCQLPSQCYQLLSHLPTTGYCHRLHALLDTVQPPWVHGVPVGHSVSSVGLTSHACMNFARSEWRPARVPLDCNCDTVSSTLAIVSNMINVRSYAGGCTPRRILCTGFCVGGAVATLAAVWAALQCPTADVRCITFGAPTAGNLAFAHTFRYITYRCSLSASLQSSVQKLTTHLTYIPDKSVHFVMASPHIDAYAYWPVYCTTIGFPKSTRQHSVIELLTGRPHCACPRQFPAWVFLLICKP